MSSPYNHHHNRRDNEEEQEEYRYNNPLYPQPPTPYPQPPPPSYGVPHSYPGPPPPSSGGYYHPQPPLQPPYVEDVYHSSHNNTYPPLDQPPIVTISDHHEEHHFRPHIHFPGSGHGSGPGVELGELASKPTFRVFSKAGGDRFSLAIRDGKVLLTYADPNDPTQHWIKDEKYSTKVKDQDGYPSFSLVNKATKHALKHSVSAHPVQLTHYTPDIFDGSVLWTESKDLGHGYRTIRMVNNVKMVLDAFHGDKDHGGVRDGTIVALYESWKGDNQNQQWKLVPY